MFEKLREKIGKSWYGLELRMGWKEKELVLPENWLQPTTPLDSLFGQVPEYDTKPELAQKPIFKFYEDPEKSTLLTYSVKSKIKQVFVFILFLFSSFGAYGVIRSNTLRLEWPFLVFHLITGGAYLDYLRRFRARKTKSWYLLQDIEE